MGQRNAPQADLHGRRLLYHGGQPMRGTDHKGHIPRAAHGPVRNGRRQLLAGNQLALHAQRYQGRALAHIGQDCPALLLQGLVDHRLAGVLFADGLLRQLDDTKLTEGTQPLLVLGHTRGKIAGVQLADTNQIDLLHVIKTPSNHWARCASGPG